MARAPLMWKVFSMDKQIYAELDPDVILEVGLLVLYEIERLVDFSVHTKLSKKEEKKLKKLIMFSDYAQEVARAFNE